MPKDLAVFMVTHNAKCNIKEEWIIPIQVGMHKGTIQFEKNIDSIGDNIAEKNKTFCELTGLYWIWKNTQYRYVGLCHYRRRFKITNENILLCLKKDKIIVPKPKYFRISLRSQYIKEHGNKEWNVMLEVLEEMFPEYYADSKIIFNNNKLYAYNMFISSRSFMEEYCIWLFNILFEVEKRIGHAIKDDYQARYIGFLAERLFTLYLIHNEPITEEIDVFLNDKINRTERFKCMINNSIFRVINKFKGDRHE